MRLAVFVEGTFMPSREGATRRFVDVLQQLSAEGIATVAIHCYRGWSDLQALAAAPFVTYAVDPHTYYDNIAEIARIVAAEAIDAVQFAEIETLAGIGLPLKRLCPGIRLVLEAHDVHSECIASFGASARDVAETRALEERVLPVCDRVLAFSDEDGDALCVRGLPRSRLRVVPFGGPVPQGPAARVPADAPVITFLGNLYHQPNARAVQTIIREIAPATRRLRSDITFEAVGDYPWSDFSAQPCDGVCLTGMVADVQPHLRRATLAIAPLTIGTGVRVKMLDYFAAGLPVLGTHLALRGPLVRDGAVLQNDIGRYPEEIVSLCGDPARRARLSERAIAVADRLSWPNIRTALAAEYLALGSEPPLPYRDAGVAYRRPFFLHDYESGGRFSRLPYAPFAGRTVRRLGGVQALR